MRQVFVRAVDSLNNRPGEWQPGITAHTIDHAMSGIRLWVSNGKPSLGIYEPFKLEAEKDEQDAIWAAYQGWCAWYFIHNKPSKSFWQRLASRLAPTF
jgi:hypothetical protein